MFVDNLFEVFLFKTTNSAVFVSYYRGCGQAVIDKRNFTKKLALTQQLQIRIILLCSYLIVLAALFLSLTKQLRSVLGV